MRSPTQALLALAAFAASSSALLAQVPNDDCGGAIAIANGLAGPYTNVGSTTSFPWPCANGGNDVWFVYQSGAAGSLTIDLCGQATYDSALEIFDGAGGCGSLVSLGCNDDTCGLQSSVTAALPAPGLYYVRVGGFNGGTGSFSLNVNGPGGGSGVLASNTSLGIGCIRQFSSFYERFPTTPSIDLSNTAFSMVSTGSGYVVIPSATAFIPPSATAANLGLGDDTETGITLSAPFAYPGGTTTTLNVCSNGHIATASNGAAFDYTPTANEFLGWTNATWAVWRDFICNATGNVKFEEVGGIACVTWDGVIGYVGTAPGTVTSTFQIQFELATGNVNFVFQSMDTVSISGFTGGDGYLVGYSGPGANADGGNTDISTIGALSLVGADVLPLTLAGTSRPVTGTNWGLSVSNIPATGILGVDVFGLSDPGINDLFFLGAPGCGLRAALDVTNAWLVTGPTHAYSLSIPSNPALLSLNLYTTSAVFQVPQVNSLGAITSNGIQGLVGNL
jgi:hypothetical protein